MLGLMTVERDRLGGWLGLDAWTLASAATGGVERVLVVM